MEDFKWDIQIIDGQLYMTGHAIDRIYEMKNRLWEITWVKLKLLKVDIATDNTLIGVGNVLELKLIKEYNIQNISNNINDIWWVPITSRKVSDNWEYFILKTDAGTEFILKGNSIPWEFYLTWSDGTVYILRNWEFQLTDLSTMLRSDKYLHAHIRTFRRRNMKELSDRLESAGYRFFYSSTASRNNFININSFDILKYDWIEIWEITKNKEICKIKTVRGVVIKTFWSEEELIKALWLWE